MSEFGHFEGEVITRWLRNGTREMELMEDFAYVDPQGERWVALKGSIIDGASIPKMFWSLMGGPFTGKYREASVIHDVYCVARIASWEDVHKMFYEACLCGGVTNAKARILYEAVYGGGPRWDENGNDLPLFEDFEEW